MKIVIAPDSYKESLSAQEVATQIEAGFREVFPDASYVKLPVADGGEGTVEAMVAASGLERVPPAKRNPLLTTSYGTGELIRSALDALKRVDVSELDQRIKSCRFEVACDVTNPLTGKLGASAVFGPQKGRRLR